MRILLTGATGFAGRHLARHLVANLRDTEIHGTTFGQAQNATIDHLHQIDLRNPDAVHELIGQVQPEQIYHLAAQASPRLSLASPWETLENNIRAQLNVFEACIAHGLAPRILVVGSADIYQSSDQAINEDTPFEPTSPYAVSKITQDMLALQYHQTHNLPVLRARPFNHFGPGQGEGFVAPDFAAQVARIETGQQAPLLEVGNLNAERDFTDVRDVVRAYALIMAKGTAGEVYNIASGVAHSIRFLLDTLVGHSETHIEVQVDPARFLPVDVPIKVGDFTRLYQTTGWQPEIPIEQSLLDLLNEYRQRIRAT